mgnify:FL=1
MKSVIKVLLAAVLALMLLGGIYVYNQILGGGVPLQLPDYHISIPTGASYEQVLDSLRHKGMLKNERAFNMLAERMAYKRDPMRSGRFEVKPRWTMLQMIRHLRSGPQAPVALVLTNERLVENVAAKSARFIEPDSLAMVSLLQDRAYLQSIGYTPDDLMSLFIPNTYEFFWNTTPQQFVERMLKEHKAFWEKNNRLQKAEALGMTPKEVYTLASVVEKETNQNVEKARIAGVYLNRLRIKMPLQADPTAVFATRDFETKRVTYYHLKFDSPYNTYMYAGLPPGPISMASIASIDAVLNPEKHNYIFFCAVGDESGLHAFAETLQEHNQNVARYVQNLKARGLR